MSRVFIELRLYTQLSDLFFSLCAEIVNDIQIPCIMFDCLALFDLYVETFNPEDSNSTLRLYVPVVIYRFGHECSKSLL